MRHAMQGAPVLTLPDVEQRCVMLVMKGLGLFCYRRAGKFPFK